MLNLKKPLLHGVIGKFGDTNHATAMEYKYDPKNIHFGMISNLWYNKP